MSWLKGILEENRRTVQGWPAWKRGEPREERTLTREAFEAINRRSQALEMAENTNGTDIVICHDDWSSVMRNDTSQRALIEQQAKEIERLREALRELHAVVKGECASLLNEDSGGDAELAIEIEALLKEEHP